MKPILLIVDDNLMMREFLRNYFSNKYLVKICENAEQAIAAIRFDQRPDLLLVDYEMAGMNGFELLKTLKTSGFYKDIPILFLSGNQESEIRIDCLKSGAEDFITKPFNPVELGLKVQRALNSTTA
jgi:CheY-like chemotaxis protein